MKKDILRSVICWILAFFLAAVVLAGVLCGFGHTVAEDRELLLSSLHESGYADTLVTEIREKWDNLAAITGIQDREALLDLVTRERVEADSLTYYENAYLGQSVLDTDSLRQEVQAFVEGYVAGTDQWFVDDAELKQNIADLVNACIADYALSVQIKLLPKVLGTVAAVAPLLEKVKWACAGMALLLAVFLFFLQVRRRETLRYLFCAMAPTPILLLVFCRFVAAEGYIYRLPLADSALKGMMEGYLEKVLAMLWQTGVTAAWAAAGLLGLYLVLCLAGSARRRSATDCTPQSNTPDCAR